MINFNNYDDEESFTVKKDFDFNSFNNWLNDNIVLVINDVKIFQEPLEYIYGYKFDYLSDHIALIKKEKNESFLDIDSFVKQVLKNNLKYLIPLFENRYEIIKPNHKLIKYISHNLEKFVDINLFSVINGTINQILREFSVRSSTKLNEEKINTIFKMLDLLQIDNQSYVASLVSAKGEFVESFLQDSKNKFENDSSCNRALLKKMINDAGMPNNIKIEDVRKRLIEKKEIKIKSLEDYSLIINELVKGLSISKYKKIMNSYVSALEDDLLKIFDVKDKFYFLQKENDLNKQLFLNEKNNIPIRFSHIKDLYSTEFVNAKSVISNNMVAESNKILEIKSGSHLYGTNTPNSDNDFVGIFVPNKEIIYKISPCYEVDLGFKSKKENGKNDENAIDRKLYELRHFVKLALDNNPNITEMLFVNNENVVFINDVGNSLLSLKEFFLHKGAYNKFMAYAISQEKKLYIKKDNYLDLKNGITYLKQFSPNDYVTSLIYNDSFLNLFTVIEDNVKVGDMKFPLNIPIKEAIREIEKRVGEKSHRKELVDTFGYDCKFASHVIRLLGEYIEMATNGKIMLPLPIDLRKIVFDVKTGQYSLLEVESIIHDFKIKALRAHEKSVLPSEPNTKIIQEFLIDTCKTF